MKHFSTLILLLFLLLSCGTSNTTHTKELKSKLDVYSNYENQNVKSKITVTPVTKEKGASSPLKLNKEPQSYQLELNNIQLLNATNQVVFEMPQEEISHESHVKNTYQGTIPATGFHIIKSTDTYQEHSHFLLVHTNGDSTYGFNGFPLFTGNKKTVFDIYSNRYDNLMYFKMYHVQHNHLQLILDVSFDQWMFDEAFQNVSVTENGIMVGYYPTSLFWENSETPSQEFLRIEVVE